MHPSIKPLALAGLVSGAIAALASGAAAAATPASDQNTVKFDKAVISGLGIRNIGSSTMSGRIAAVSAGHKKNGDTVLYVGAASGGVWKSTDGGTTFKPKFDKQPVQSIGSIALDPHDPDNVWIGTGEGWTRNSTSIGNGIYHSTDGGESWTNTGLPNSERIVKLAVNSNDSNSVLACVTGKLWSDSTERGVYRTTDGGKNWTQVLKGGNASTGCGGMSVDAKNPNVVFASLWDFRRKGWTFRSGGENADAPSASGLYRSADGGATWSEVTGGGLPKKPYGRIGLAVAPSNSNVVYAFVESVKSALFRSDDGGKTWDRRDDSQMMVWRPFYFANLIVDPTNPDRVFKPDLALIQSLDGGKTFANVGGGAHGDFHDVWIDPADPQKVVAGDDGGLWFSKDGGNKWWKANNLPVSQFYHVSLDNDDPYHVYGGLQDNSSWVGDSSYPGGITNNRWENMFGGDGFWMFDDPSDHKFLYAEAQGGTVGRVNRVTHETRDIQPLANYKEKLRWNWNTPIALSPSDKDTLYIGAQFLFRSHDHGQTWDRISPDLTTDDKQKQKQEESGGITIDNSAAEMHTTIYAISESPKDSYVIWVGTDDGNVQVTRDGGKSWHNVVANAHVPANSWVSYIDASHFDAGTAYVTFDRHTFGDMSSMVFKTTDYGMHWQALSDATHDKGLRGYAHVVRNDPVKPGLLYAGTEFGLWISNDDGANWGQFKPTDFPAVAVRDMAIQPRDNDLVLATHGRGMWIIDDLTPLRALTPQILQTEATFLPGRPANQLISSQGGWAEGDASYAGTSATSDLPANDALHTQMTALSAKADKIRKEIVATKEGGAITGEERLREHMDRLYGGLMAYEGKPAASQVAYTGALQRELDDVAKEFADLQSGDLQKADSALKAKNLPEIALPDHAPIAWQYNGDKDARPAERD